MASEELMKLKAHLRSLEDFMKGPAYVGFLSARREELRCTNEAIISLEPIDRRDEIEQFKLRGERRCLEGMITVFDDAMDELQDRISEMEDEETNVVSPNGNGF